MSRPPTFVETLLRRVLPKGTVGDSIVGDLREAYAADSRMDGPHRAMIRYLRSALSIGVRFGLSEAAGILRVDSTKRRMGDGMSSLGYDLRQASKILVRRPGLALVAVISLGLGIGANTAIFSLVNTILMRPLPYPNSQELVEAFRIDERVTGLNPTLEQVSGLWAVPYEVHQDWMTMSSVFEAGGGYADSRFRLGQGDATTSVLAVMMTSGTFRALGVEPRLGRYFLPEEDEPGTPALAVLGYGLWQSQFGGDPDILGKPIALDDESYTVTGVMPRDFAFPDDRVGLWISFSDRRKTSPVRNGGYLKVVARLKDGVTLEEARQDMERVAAQIGAIHPEEAEHGVGLFPLKDMVIGGSGTNLLILLGAVVLILLIACTNIAGLFLVRASERRREIGVRRALGAGRERLIVQQMGECLILALLGGAAGWMLATVGLEPVLSLMPQELPRIHEMRVDRSLLFTAMGFAVLTGILTGLLPAVWTARTPISAILGESGRGSSAGKARNRTQVTLVASQLALAFLLLSGAALVIRSLTSLLSVDTGMDTENIALAAVSFPSGVETLEEAQQHFRRLEEGIRALPGVVDVGGADQMPFSGGWSAPPVTIDGPEGQWDAALNCPTVTPSYFTTMGIPVLMGRGLSETDTRDSEPVVVVSQAMADRMAPGASPLGYRIRINSPDSIWRTIVGVVGDVRYRLDFDRHLMAYVPSGQDPTYLDNWVIKAAVDPMTLAGPFRGLREKLDPAGTHRFVAMDDEIRGSAAVVSARFTVILLGSLAVLAGVLVVFGIYGVLAYLVQLRSREIGIQLALGAERGHVVRSVLRRGLFMVGLGLGTGILLALAFGRILESQLFGVKPWDPISLAGSALLLLASTMAASWLPARRASRVDPVETLKGE